MTEEAKPQYDVRSRGHKTKGYSYKDRYINDKMCPECGGTSIYRDVWHTTVSFKCMKRSCRYNWFESRTAPAEKEEQAMAEGYEKVTDEIETPAQEE